MKAGHECVVSDTHPQAVKDVVAKGAKSSDSIADFAIWRFFARRHAVNERHRTAFRLKFCLENKRTLAIAPPNASDWFRG